MALKLTPEAPRTLDDLQAPPPAPQTREEMMRAAQEEARRAADAIDAGEAPAPEGDTFTVTLQARHAEYLRERAAAFGETPERHLESILRQFRQLDAWRTTDTRPQGPGQPAGTGRRG